MALTLDAVDWPVRTERLVLRRPTPDDTGAMWRYRRLEEVRRWTSGGSQTEAEFHEHVVGSQRLARTVLVEHEGVVVGELMVRIEDAWRQVEVADRARDTCAVLGWAFHPEVGGRGLATEAVREILRVCFEDLALHHVTAGAVAANEASWRLMERVGMRREHVAVGQFLHRSGDWLDCYGYAMLADEWCRH